MKKYLVGGACRDALMGIKPKDRDYVLINCNDWDIRQLIIQGYQQVGADFPVFLSPEGEEYALARIERKTGVGYNGFTVETKNVTLEQDLSRRDLTINSVAQDLYTKEYIDPFNGQSDIKNKVLRHVSDAFKEDPVRIIRLSRFLCRYSDFTIAPETDKMVREMVLNGEINNLTKERVYVEFEKAFTEKTPSIFLKYLNDIGALKILLPDFKCLVKELKQIDYIARNASNPYIPEYIWCILLENLDSTKIKGSDIGKLKIPINLIKFSTLVQKFKDKITKFNKLKPEEMITLFDTMNIKNLGGEEFLYKFTEYFILEKTLDYQKEELIIKVYDIYINTDLQEIEDKQKSGTLTGLEIKNAVYNKRLSNVLKMFK